MIDDILSKLISEEVAKAMESNEDVIVSELASCLDPEDPVDQKTARMVTKAIKLSMRLTTHLVIRILEGADVLHLAPDGTPILYELQADD